jgi:hypothetical protein
MSHQQLSMIDNSCDWLLACQTDDGLQLFMDILLHSEKTFTAFHMLDALVHGIVHTNRLEVPLSIIQKEEADKVCTNKLRGMTKAAKSSMIPFSRVDQRSTLTTLTR